MPKSLFARQTDRPYVSANMLIMSLPFLANFLWLVFSWSHHVIPWQNHLSNSSALAPAAHQLQHAKLSLHRLRCSRWDGWKATYSFSFHASPSWSCQAAGTSTWPELYLTRGCPYEHATSAASAARRLVVVSLVSYCKCRDNQRFTVSALVSRLRPRNQLCRWRCGQWKKQMVILGVE